MDIIGHLPIDLYSSKYIYRVAMTSKEHGLKKYKLVNALTMDNPLSLVEKIKNVISSTYVNLTRTQAYH